MSTEPATNLPAGSAVDDDRIGARRLLAGAGFRRLLLTRFAAQWGDGVYQVALAGAVVFNPERQPDALTIAAAFTALLLPYSIVGPFAGALLDRWDRRSVLMVANLLRGTLVLATAFAVAGGASNFVLSLLALVVIGISRFVGSGLSASLPHVVPLPTLVEANALATTMGAVLSAIGGVSAVGLRAVLGEDDLGSGLTTGVAAIASITAALIASRFAANALGPDEVTEPRGTIMAVLRGLGDGAKAALSAASVTAGFVALLAHRAAFGASLLVTVLLMRYGFTGNGPLEGGLPALGLALSLGAAGIFVAGLTTARLVGLLGRRRAVVAALVLAATAQLGLGLPMILPTVLVASFVITYAGQVIKLCVDAAVQRDVGDDTRGRVFALYDTLFNITTVLAIGVAAQFVPFDGRSAGMVVGTTVVYLLGAVGYLAVLRARGVTR